MGKYTLLEMFYWVIRLVFGTLSRPFTTIANWATDRLNKSYYKPQTHKEKTS